MFSAKTQDNTVPQSLFVPLPKFVSRRDESFTKTLQDLLIGKELNLHLGWWKRMEKAMAKRMAKCGL